MNTPIPTEHSNVPITNNLGMAASITLIVIIIIMSAYYQTTWDMVATWWRSETYAHGFLILPFSAYMIWSKRANLRILHFRPNYLTLFLLCGMGFIWLIAKLASVQVLAQYVLIAMIPATVGAILGHQVFLATAFPLLYLFFAVPFGDVLIPPLIEFTADFTVGALQLSGIPVYREGTFFSLPTGNWSVVEACSGLRYLIASVTLGTLYAYLTYNSLKRRLMFILLAIIVPIIANGIRAYLIVMTGHLSDMTLAVGVDHLIYGWIFFGLVMLLLFWIGSFWREDDIDVAVTVTNTDIKDISAANKSASIRQTLCISATVLIVVLIWPVYAAYLEKNSTQNIRPKIDLAFSQLSNQWKSNANLLSDWEPTYVGEPIKFRQDYQRLGQSVRLYITYYYNQTQGKELINIGNYLGRKGAKPWRNIGKSERSVMVGSREMIITQNQLYSNTSKLLVWRWYWLNNNETINPYLAKAFLARNKLLGNGDSGAEIIITATYEDNPDEAVPVLQQFASDMVPIITKRLQNVQNY